MKKLQKSESVFHEWIHKNCKKGEIIEIRFTERAFTAVKSKLNKKDLSLAPTGNK